VRADCRRRTLLWTCVIVVPFVLFALPFEQARRQWQQRQVPHNAAGHLVIVTAAGLMEGQAACTFPNRLETDRLVMYYHDLLTPERDAALMDEHVARLETAGGAPLRAKIHWVRGTLLGQGNCSFLGLALGSTQSPADWSQLSYLDRHELAHAVITQQRPVTADPPMILHEGWAESQSGMSSDLLAARALEARMRDADLSVRDLFGPEWYHYEGAEVYYYGGALVDFLIRRFAVARFVDLYNRCGRSTFDADFQAVYGQSLDELEASFWEDAEAVGR